MILCKIQHRVFIFCPLQMSENFTRRDVSYQKAPDGRLDISQESVTPITGINLA